MILFRESKVNFAVTFLPKAGITFYNEYIQNKEVTMPDDEQVMAQVREGRVEMLAILFERHHVRLFNFFLRLTAERSLSEDLVQEVFLRILKYRHTYRGDSKFTTWMYQIGRNAHIDHPARPTPGNPHR